MTWIILIISIVYALLIGLFIIGSWRLPRYTPSNSDPKESFTLIIPFRNEQKNLPDLFKAITLLEYPNAQFEILLVDDDSQDLSVSMVTDFINLHPHLPLVLLQNKRVSGSPKKDALVVGIQHASYDWIVTTDADCTFPHHWLYILDNHIQDKRPKMVVGPVAIQQSPSITFTQAFEQLDFLSLMGATQGGFGIKMPFLCNGAHLAYHKEAFMQVGGFTSNNHIASGDDHFLLEKFIEIFKENVTYLKTPEAVITTKAQISWDHIISQRVRWASKSKSYNFWFSKMVGIVVFAMNICALLSMVLLILYGVQDFFSAEYALVYRIGRFAKAYTSIIPSLAFLLLLKYLIDFVLIAKTSHFFNRMYYLQWYPLMMVCYPIVTTYIALKSLTSSYKWKERHFKQ